MNSSTTLRDALCDFRTALYRCFDRRSDALFKIGDALLTAGPLPSPVHLSLEPVHRRGWGSFYAALAHGHIDVDALRSLVTRHPLDEERPVYAVDASVWARCEAETSPARGFYYHPSRHSAGQPTVAGWAYQWIAQLGFTRDSWSAPVGVRRLHPSENASVVAAEQIKSLLRHRSPSAPAPLFVFDAGYDPVQLAEALAGAAALGPGPSTLGAMLLCGSTNVQRNGATATTRSQVHLSRVGHVADSLGRAPMRGQAIRAGSGARLGRAACEDARSSDAGHPPATSDPARHASAR